MLENISVIFLYRGDSGCFYMLDEMMISNSPYAYFDDLCEEILKKQITRTVDSINRSVGICYSIFDLEHM